MTREEIRACVKKRREDASKIQAAELSARICERIVAMAEYLKAKRILCYAALPDEVQTGGLLREILRSGRSLYLPRTRGSNLEVAHVTADTKLERGAYGVPEPVTDELADISDVDLVLAPGVAFDREGNRLGYGKGYFDRLLKDCACPKVGLAYEMQMVDHVPEHQGDVPMDKVVTEERIYVRGADKAD